MAEYDFDAIRHKLSKYIDESRMTHTQALCIRRLHLQCIMHLRAQRTSCYVRR